MDTKEIKKRLISFEEEIAELFNQPRIKAPVHLYSGNEEAMISVFEDVKEKDWVFCSWRSHYQCLLKGVPESLLKAKILAGQSISLCFPEYRIYSSAIVGGNVPVALDTALAIRRNKSDAKVHCFMGEMTAETGIVHECFKYAKNFELPIRFIVEDNGLSVCTDTRKAWGNRSLSHQNNDDPMIVSYRYKNKYPHAGAGVRVQF